MSLPPIIGIYSPVPGSGKTTVADFLASRHYIRLPFADTLKAMVARFLLDFDYAPSEVAELLTNDKQRTLPEVGVTTRHLLATLGTEWGRTCVHTDVWLRAWACRYNRYFLSDPDTLVVVDDVRFMNEAEFLRNFNPNTQLWQIIRPDASAPESVLQHPSEGGLSTFDFDVTIRNDGSLDDLLRVVSELVPSPVTV